MTNFDHNFANVNGVNMHYVTSGSGGVPLVLLHGYPQSWYCWKEVIPRLTAAGFFCIAPDLRGLGDSTRPASGYDKKTMASDVHALVTQHLGIDKFNVAGHDWGGAVAFSLAAHHRESVERLVVVDVAIPGDGQANIGQGGRRWHHTFLQTPDLPEALVAGKEEAWVRWFYENYGHHPRVIDEESVAEYLRTYTQPGALRAGFAYYRAVSRDIEDNQKLEKLTIPVLGIGGGTSFGRGSEVEESLRRMASDVQALVFDDCGHWVPEEKPDELAAAMVRFLS